jgi:hypothetical protein
MSDTITFKLYQYVDGNGADVFRLKRRGLFGLWVWVSFWFDGDRHPYHYATREKAIIAAQAEADAERKKLVDRAHGKRAAALRLVVIAEIKA